MPKSIIICCDGTANEFSKARTNVAKLFYTFPKGDLQQPCTYHPGVGTRAPPGFVTRGGARIAEILGLSLGYGLTEDLADLYSYLCDTFQPGDRVFLFGFSRGSYTVRALASMLRMYGLIGPRNPTLVPYIVRMLWAVRALRKREARGVDLSRARSEYFALAADFDATFSTPCAPYFVGLWDTVSSVGWFTSPVALPYTANNDAIAVARHAISIDERRAFFRPNQFRPKQPSPGPRDLREVWFPGVHSDVGGGYPENESGLSKYALRWMIEEAVDHGLRVDSARVQEVLGLRGGRFQPAHEGAKMHESLVGGWKLLEYVPLPRWNEAVGRNTWRANRGARRTMPPNAVVHDAAWSREGGAYAQRLPPGAVRLSQAVWPAPAPLPLAPLPPSAAAGLPYLETPSSSPRSQS